MFNCKYDLTGSVFKFKVVLKATSWTLILCIFRKTSLGEFGKLFFTIVSSNFQVDDLLPNNREILGLS